MEQPTRDVIYKSAEEISKSYLGTRHDISMLLIAISFFLVANQVHSPTRSHLQGKINVEHNVICLSGPRKDTQVVSDSTVTQRETIKRTA